jgi:hypothetical protein
MIDGDADTAPGNERKEGPGNYSPCCGAVTQRCSIERVRHGHKP